MPNEQHPAPSSERCVPARPEARIAAKLAPRGALSLAARVIRLTFNLAPPRGVFSSVTRALVIFFVGLVVALAADLSRAGVSNTKDGAATAATADTAETAAADTVAATLATESATAAEDTVPVLEGITFVDIDSLLLAGEGVLVAFEDTIPFAQGTIDTVLVAAPRVKIDEVVRRIGERLEADFYAIENHEFTGIYTVVARDDPADTSRYTLYEGAERIHKNDDGTLQYARLWQRERRYENGELKSEKVEDEIEAEWGDMSRQLAIPFSLESGDQYNYAILDRKLVGMNLVYKMRFWPRDQFAALPSGIVWVDYSDWVIRRFEAEMTGAVPMPLILKSIPVYKLRRVKRGDWWVVSDAYVRAELRRIPLLKIPGSITLHFRTRDHVINGVAYPDAEVR